jgi:hypothetical protein
MLVLLMFAPNGSLVDSIIGIRSVRIAMVISVWKARKLHSQERDFSSAKIEVFEFDGMSGFRRKATSKRYYVEV